jgi:hypothetical protein
MNSKGLIILMLTLLVLTAVVFTWYNNQISREVPQNTVTHKPKTESLGATIYAEGSNPVASSVPDTNAISGAVTNPFDTYVNPFETQ